MEALECESLADGVSLARQAGHCKTKEQVHGVLGHVEQVKVLSCDYNIGRAEVGVLVSD
jgi:hypothetical protein